MKAPTRTTIDDTSGTSGGTSGSRGAVKGSQSGSAGDVVGDASDRIVAGILADADTEAARIIAEAESAATAVRERTDAQVRSLADESARRAEAQARAIIADAEARAAIETRKGRLSAQERLARDIIARVVRHFSDSKGKDGYRSTLLGWIVEAAVGLSVAEARVNASRDELPLIDAALLREAEAAVLAATGKPVVLSKVEGDPVVGQGVYLESVDGRLVYDNRLATRLERERTTIRTMIYRAVDAGGVVGSVATGNVTGSAAGSAGTAGEE